jgi:hypothetical protein
MIYIEKNEENVFEIYQFEKEFISQKLLIQLILNIIKIGIMTTRLVLIGLVLGNVILDMKKVETLVLK